MSKLSVVAFGGNALLRAGQKGTIDEQEDNAYKASKNLVKLINRDYNLVVTHGNGPQVGNILLANTAGNRQYGIPDMPLDVNVAYSQGFIGYLLEQQLRNVLLEEDLDRDIISIITRVLVNKDDPAFKNPTKPIGPFFTKEESDNMVKNNDNFTFREDAAGRGWRKVVASPTPLVIFNRMSIEKIAREGHIVISVGGGGIPCFYEAENKLQGIDAVFDKDLASALLAREIKADAFFILTDVPNVYINFKKPGQKKLEKITVKKAEDYYNKGEFAEGSMGPKILAAIDFVKNGGGETIITESTMLSDPNCGTRIVP